jgi:hypothetical protein
MQLSDIPRLGRTDSEMHDAKLRIVQAAMAQMSDQEINAIRDLVVGEYEAAGWPKVWLDVIRKNDPRKGRATIDWLFDKLPVVAEPANQIVPTNRQSESINHNQTEAVNAH